MSLLPDPVAFAAAALEAEGALVDLDSGPLAMLSSDLAAALSTPDEFRLSNAPAVGLVACGFGTPLLEALIERRRRALPLAAGALEAAPVRASQARAHADRFALRNAVSEITEVREGHARWLVLTLGWTAEADERREGLVTFAVHPDDGGAPDRAWLGLVTPGSLRPVRAPSASPEAPRWVVRRARREIEPALDAVIRSTARRHAREHARLSEYYRTLLAETRQPRRRADPAAVADKVRHLERERDAKLNDLLHRYQLRVHTRPIAALWVEAPAAVVLLRARRRKRERTLSLRLPAGASGFDALPCDGCDGWVGRPLLCDDQLHVLCETCAPTAEGRARCPACAA